MSHFGCFRDYLLAAWIGKSFRSAKTPSFGVSAMFGTDFRFPINPLALDRKQRHFPPAEGCFHTRPFIFHSSACPSEHSQAFYRLENGSE
jgi:hypothetical protein